LPPGETGDEDHEADAAMQKIADAVKHHDPTALKKLFSPAAREKATDLDSELASFLSVFPSGMKSWTDPDGGQPAAQSTENGFAEELYATYKVSANGTEYDLYFADVTSDTAHPDEVGIIAIGATPWSKERSGARTPFDAWVGQSWTSTIGSGTPGVYVPPK
jgi:hypothetical protein